MPLYTIDTRGPVQDRVRQEWLLTNGLGAYASSTTVGCNTRRYHGLLVAATLPPVGRVMALNRVGEMLYVDGTLFELSVNQFGNDLHPRGDQYLKSFELDNGLATWVYDVDGVRVTKQIILAWMKNLAGVRYAVEAPARKKVQLRLQPFVSLRDFHSLLHEEVKFDVRPAPDSVEVSRDGNRV